MAEITAALVKQLRDLSGAGMMDAKKALVENDGDMDAAVDWLRTKGLAKAAKKSGRTAADGLVAVATLGTAGTVVEVNAETDFVARNDQFQAFVRDVATVALAGDGSLEQLSAAPYPGGSKNVADTLTELIAKVGENMSLRRVARLSVEEGVVASYVHNAVSPGLGKIGVLVGLQSAGDAAELEAFGRQIAMHVAATSPAALTVDGLDGEAIERERAVLTEQARDSGKPEDIIAKMVEGRLRKYYEEVVLMEQIFVIDGETKVGKAVEAKGKELGAPITLTGFVALRLGEGIEKEAVDFAAEVQKAVQG